MTTVPSAASSRPGSTLDAMLLFTIPFTVIAWASSFPAIRAGLAGFGALELAALRFAIAGVFAVNPVSRQTTTQLQQFVVTSDVNSDAAGNATIPIAPAITPTGQFQNVTVGPADNAAITIVGTSGTVTEQNVAFHRDAFTLACADLPLPGGVDMAARKSDPQTGLSVRAVRAYNITTDQFPLRLDILYGIAALYPEWSCRIQA